MATQAYFTVPKVLDTHPRYANLSTDAKYLYARMRDTMKLSIKNNWRDSLGVYIKMARTSMAQLLHKSLPTIRKIIKELREAGLIFDLRMGLTKCNRIYVRLLEGESETDLSPAKKELPPSSEKPAFIPDRNDFSPNKRYSNHSNPSENNNDGWKWFISEGSKWFDKKGQLWEFVNGEIREYMSLSEEVRFAKRFADEFMPVMG